MSQSAAAALLRAWQSREPVAATLAALDACHADDVTGALAAIDALFADDTFVSATIARCIAAAPADTGPGIGFPALGEGVQEGLLLIQHPLATVSLAVVPHAVLGARKAAAAGEGMIGFAGTISRYRVLRAGGARLGWWRCARIDAAFDAVTAPACRRDRTQTLVDGDWLLVDGAEEGFVVEAATGDLVLLQATLTAGRAPLRTEHDASTLAYAAASATDPAASHRQMMATLLRVLGRADAVPALVRMTDDPAFFVRWHALRELMALDRPAALPALRRMTRDPRADIAVAATAALTRFNPCPA